MRASAILSGQAHVIEWANAEMLRLADQPLVGRPAREVFIEDRHEVIHDFLDLCWKHGKAGQLMTWSPLTERWGLLTIRPRPDGLRLDWRPAVLAQAAPPDPGSVEAPAELLVASSRSRGDAGAR